VLFAETMTDQTVRMADATPANTDNAPRSLFHAPHLSCSLGSQ
jgi:hypothetical protein